MSRTLPASLPTVERLRGDSGGRFQGDGGYAILLTALLIIPIMAFTAFATDVGAWYAQGAKMQRAADASSLAGVVWLDDVNQTRYDTEARAVATRNGFTHNVNGTSVVVQKVASNKIRTTITRPGEQFFSRLFLGGISLDRTAVSAFNLPVPLGSPCNFLGTGNLFNDAYTSSALTARENKWLGISGYCTRKTQGDRKAAKNAGGSGASNDCASGELNTEYSDSNYAFYIDVPDNRTQAIDVVVFHGNFTGSSSTDGRTGEFAPAGMNGLPAMNTHFTLYQADDTAFDDNDNPTVASQNGCQSGLGTDTNGTRNFPSRAVNTPDDNYNVNITTGAGVTNAQGYWMLCRLPTSAPAGKYIMRVRNQSTATAAPVANNGSNNFSILALPVTSNAMPSPSGQVLCDARTNAATCPRVYSKDFMGIMASPGAGNIGQFFLSEIGEEHAGKKMEVQLWDSAEGALRIKIQKPTGTNTWVDVPFSYFSTNNSTPISTSASTGIYNGGSRLAFDNQLITIQVDLATNYNPPDDNEWWRIYYQFDANATDRSTWSVKILGDPVHLTE